MIVIEEYLKKVNLEDFSEDLVLKNLNAFQRKVVHEIGDTLNLYHESVIVD